MFSIIINTEPNHFAILPVTTPFFHNYNFAWIKVKHKMLIDLLTAMMIVSGE